MARGANMLLVANGKTLTFIDYDGRAEVELAGGEDAARRCCSPTVPT